MKTLYISNSKEGNWRDVENMAEILGMERNIMEQAPRAPKAVGLEKGCIARDAPPQHLSSKSHNHNICDDRGCIPTHMDLNLVTGRSKMVGKPGGSAYNGTVSTTVSGRTCKVWNTLTDPYSDYAKFGAHNYCRGYANTVFCFTTDPNKAFEECEIRRCLKLTKGEM